MTRASLAAAACAAFLMVGCGGGGGDAPNTYQLSFDKTTLQATGTVGTSSSVEVTAELDRTVAQTVNVAIIDAKGVFSPSVQLLPLSATRYRVTLRLNAALPAGRHQGTLQVRLCLDNPYVCAQPLAGSPWSLPYDITVTPATNGGTPAPTDPGAVPTYAVQFESARLTIESHVGEFGAVPFTARLVADAGAGPVYPRTHDPLGPLGSLAASGQPLSGNTFRVDLNVSNVLAEGTYQGELELRLCKDPACASEHRNSPARLPYTIKALSAKNLTPLTAIAGAPEWAMHQGNAAHTGHVPVTLDAARFNRRWRWAEPATVDPTGQSLTPAVTADGTVVLGRSGRLGSSLLFGLKEADGSTAWTHSFGEIHRLNPPATNGSRVFAATSGHEDTAMWTFAVDSGMQLASVPFGSQWDSYFAPTVQGGAVYTNGGSYGGLLSYDAVTAGLNWFATLPQFEAWTPAVDDQRIYAYVSSSLYAIEKATGATAFTILDPGYSWSGYTMDSAPIIGSGSRVLTVGVRSNGANRLIAFDVAQRTVAWTTPGNFMQSPALARGAVYATADRVLHVYDEATGALRWSWGLPASDAGTFSTPEVYGNVVVTDNLAFVSSTNATYAVALDSRQAVWTYPVGGRLALSPRGVLHIVTTPRTGVASSVVAINLR